MTYAEYCALEHEAEVKHEYLRGEVFATTRICRSSAESRNSARPTSTR